MRANAARAWVLGLVCRLISLREREPVAAWVEREIDLPPEVSPMRPGPYRAEVTPLAGVVFDWFDDPAWRELIVVKSSQCGVSQAFQALTCYIAAMQLGNILWVLESAEKAKELNNERLKPMLQKGCRALEGVLPEDKEDLQNKVLWLKGCMIRMAGARSAGQVASRTVRYVFGDEGDEWPTELQGNESNAWTLLRERAKLIDDAKLALCSKPRNAVAPEVTADHKMRNRRKQDDGIIWQEYLTGTRHKCFIPCPHCGTYQELIWEQVKFGHCRNEAGTGWDLARMLEETYYECVNAECVKSEHKGKITEEQKVEAVLRHREWRATNLGDDVNVPVPRKMSVHISDLYANSREFPTLTLGQLAVKYCTARTVSDRRAFRRGHLALPVEMKVLPKLQHQHILSLAGAHERGTISGRRGPPVVLALMVDVQQHGGLYKWVKIAFWLNDSADVVDYGETEDGAELKAILDKPVPVVDEEGLPTGQEVKAQIGWIDEGDGLTTKAVLDVCVLPGLYRRLSPVKGRGKSQTEHMKDRVTLQNSRTHQGKPIDRYLVDSDYFLDELYEERIGKNRQVLEALVKGETPPAPRLSLFRDPPTDFCAEFCTEKKDWHLRGSKLVFGWLEKPEGGPNDYSDCVKYGLAMWFRMKPMLAKVMMRREIKGG